jgi:MFS_1 like family
MDENDASRISALQEPLLLNQPQSLVVDPATETLSAGVSPLLRLSEQPTIADNHNDPSPEDQQQQAHRIVDGLCWERSLLIKSLYFLDALGASTWGRFSAIYYNSHGLNSQQVGCIEGLRTAIPTLSMVVWGIISDRFQCRKRVWVFNKSVSTSILLLLALPYVFRSFLRILGKVLLCFLVGVQWICSRDIIQLTVTPYYTQFYFFFFSPPFTVSGIHLCTIICFQRHFRCLHPGSIGA